jgi:GNAT superfamily N-acetyltransferase
MSSIPFHLWERSPSPTETDATLCRRVPNAAIPSPTVWARYLCHRLRYAWRYAAALRELHELDERTLKDVGLHRSSLHAIADACARREVFGRFGAVRVRRIDAADLPRCVEFGRLLPHDIRLRFGRLAALGDGDTVRRLFGLDDGKTETIGVFDSSGELLGLATVAWVRPATAEVAFIVRSDVQHRGLGATLLAHVIRNARAAGFTQLLAQIDHGNIPARRLIRRFGFELTGDSPVTARAQLTLAA